MRKIFFLLAGIAIASCQSKKDVVPTAISTSKQPVSSITNANDVAALNTLQSLLANDPQTFTVSAKTSKKIEGKKGLRVTINTNDLETLDGKDVTGDVQVTIKELQKASDMIANNCPTISDGKILVSDGSYYVGMTSNGKELRIKKDKAMQMEFPKNSTQDMELFTGERDADGTMNWKPLNKNLHADNEKLSSAQTLAKNNSETGWMPKNYLDQSSSYRNPTDVSSLQQYEDSIHETRRAYIICHYMHMKQEDIRNVMEAPYKMPRYYVSRFGMYFSQKASPSVFVYYNNESEIYVVPIKNSDSVYYYADYYKYHTTATHPKINLDSMNRANMDVAIDNELPQNKNALQVNLPGTEKVRIRYYDPVEVKNVGWFNCDHYYEAPDGITPLYTLNIQGNVPANVGVYLIFRDMNAMLLQKACTFGKNTVAIKQALPLNSKIEFLVYSKVDNHFVECKRKLTVTKDMVLPISFAPVNDEQVKTAFSD